MMFRKNYEYPQHRETAATADFVKTQVHPHLEGVSVLVTDDERDARQMLAQSLENCGATVMTAYNVDDAMALVGKNKFDIIVSDLAMPGGDGFSLVRRLRLRGDRTPVIALSAMRGPNIEKEVKDAGFAQHVDKPIELSYLTSAVADVVRLHREGKKPSQN